MRKPIMCTISQLKIGDKFIEYGHLQLVRDGYDKTLGLYKAHRYASDGETMHTAYYTGNELVERK